MPTKDILPWIILAAVLGLEVPGVFTGAAKDEAVAASRAATEWKEENAEKLARLDMLELQAANLQAQNSVLLDMMRDDLCESRP